MPWHRLINKLTGEQQFVVSLDSLTIGDYDVTLLAVDRAPTEFETVNADGTLTLNTVLRDAMLAEAELASVTHQERKRRTNREARATLIDDMLAEGMINLTMANKLRARLGPA